MGPKYQTGSLWSNGCTKRSTLCCQKKCWAKSGRRAQAGDRDALGFLYARYADNVYGYVRSIVHQEVEQSSSRRQSRLGWRHNFD